MKQTIHHDAHVAMGAAMIAFAGWRLPVQFDGALSEHKHCRQAASLFDTGHMGIFHFRGDKADLL